MARNHLADIRIGRVDKGNIIGIRKALSAAWRDERGYGNGVTSPADALNIASHLQEAIRDNHPTATGDLHDSGLAVLRSPRWHKRFTDAQCATIASASRFDLIRFDDIARGHFVPVWRVIGDIGTEPFAFRNIPWQAVAYSSDSTLQSGPTVEPEQ